MPPLLRPSIQDQPQVVVPIAVASATDTVLLNEKSKCYIFLLLLDINSRIVSNWELDVLHLKFPQRVARRACPLIRALCSVSPAYVKDRSNTADNHKAWWSPSEFPRLLTARE